MDMSTQDSPRKKQSRKNPSPTKRMRSKNLDELIEVQFQIADQPSPNCESDKTCDDGLGLLDGSSASHKDIKIEDTGISRCEESNQQHVTQDGDKESSDFNISEQQEHQDKTNRLPNLQSKSNESKSTINLLKTKKLLRPRKTVEQIVKKLSRSGNDEDIQHDSQPADNIDAVTCSEPISHLDEVCKVLPVKKAKVRPVKKAKVLSVKKAGLPKSKCNEGKKTEGGKQNSVKITKSVVGKGAKVIGTRSTRRAIKSVDKGLSKTIPEPAKVGTKNVQAKRKKSCTAFAPSKKRLCKMESDRSKNTEHSVTHTDDKTVLKAGCVSLETSEIHSKVGSRQISRRNSCTNSKGSSKQSSTSSSRRSSRAGSKSVSRSHSPGSPTASEADKELFHNLTECLSSLNEDSAHISTYMSKRKTPLKRSAWSSPRRTPSRLRALRSPAQTAASTSKISPAKAFKLRISPRQGVSKRSPARSPRIPRIPLKLKSPTRASARRKLYGCSPDKRNRSKGDSSDVNTSIVEDSDLMSMPDPVTDSPLKSVPPEISTPSNSRPFLALDDELSNSPFDRLEIVHSDNDTIDQELDAKAQQNSMKLTAINVRNIIHQVITNEDVLDMVRNTLQEEGLQDQLKEAIFETKMTRSRVKEVVQNGVLPMPWSLSPIKMITAELPAKPQFLEMSFSDNEDADEEYDPAKEPPVSDEDDDNESMCSTQTSEVGSPLPCSTPKTPHGLSALTPKLTPGLMLPPPIPADTNTCDSQATSDSVLSVPTIAHRTRSKLPLDDQDLEEIENNFIAPDITADLYNAVVDDKDWQQFLASLTTSKRHDAGDTGDNEDNDPEYNCQIDVADLENDSEELRDDRAVKVSKKELDELMEELFEPYGGVDFVIAPDESSVPDSEPVTPKVPVDCGESEGSEDRDTNEEEIQSRTSKIIRADLEKVEEREPYPGRVPPLRLDPQMATVVASNLRRIQKGDDSVPSGVQMAPPQVAKASATDLKMSLEECSQLIDQCRKHVQLLATTYVQAAGVDNPALDHVCQFAKMYLVEIDAFAEKHRSQWGVTVFDTPNLSGAQQLTKERYYCSNEQVNAAVKAGVIRNVMTESAYDLLGLNYTQMSIFCRSPVFIFPQMLPECALTDKHQVKSRLVFLDSEDNLLAMGLDQFQHLPSKYAYIQKYLLPTKQTHQLRFRAKNQKQRVGDSSNVIKYLLSNDHLPDFPQYLEVEPLQEIVPPCMRDPELLTKWFKVWDDVTRSGIFGVDPAGLRDLPSQPSPPISESGSVRSTDSGAPSTGCRTPTTGITNVRRTRMRKPTMTTEKFLNIRAATSLLPKPVVTVQKEIPSSVGVTLVEIASPKAPDTNIIPLPEDMEAVVLHQLMNALSSAAPCPPPRHSMAVQSQCPSTPILQRPMTPLAVSSPNIETLTMAMGGSLSPSHMEAVAQSSSENLEGVVLAIPETNMQGVVPLNVVTEQTMVPSPLSAQSCCTENGQDVFVLTPAQLSQLGIAVSRGNSGQTTLMPSSASNPPSPLLAMATPTITTDTDTLDSNIISSAFSSATGISMNYLRDPGIFSLVGSPQKTVYNQTAMENSLPVMEVTLPQPENTQISVCVNQSGADENSVSQTVLSPVQSSVPSPMDDLPIHSPIQSVALDPCVVSEVQDNHCTVVSGASKTESSSPPVDACSPGVVVPSPSVDPLSDQNLYCDESTVGSGVSSDAPSAKVEEVLSAKVEEVPPLLRQCRRKVAYKDIRNVRLEDDDSRQSKIVDEDSLMSDPLLQLRDEGEEVTPIVEDKVQEPRTIVEALNLQPVHPVVDPDETPFNVEVIDRSKAEDSSSSNLAVDPRSPNQRSVQSEESSSEESPTKSTIRYISELAMLACSPSKQKAQSHRHKKHHSPSPCLSSPRKPFSRFRSPAKSPSRLQFLPIRPRPVIDSGSPPPSPLILREKPLIPRPILPRGGFIPCTVTVSPVKMAAASITARAKKIIGKSKKPVRPSFVKKLHSIMPKATPKTMSRGTSHINQSLEDLDDDLMDDDEDEEDGGISDVESVGAEDVLEEEELEEMEEMEDEDHDEEEDHLAELMAASTTIRFAPKRSGLALLDTERSKLNRNRLKREATLELLAPDLVETDPLRDERDTAFAQWYLSQVRQVLKDEPQKYEQFITLLYEFSHSKQTPVQLYAEVAEVLGDNPELVRDFACFLRPDQARLCDCFINNLQFRRVREFLRKLEVHFKKAPNQLQRVLRFFSQWGARPCPDPRELQDCVRPLLRGNQHLLDEFLLLFEDGRPPESMLTDFEDVQLDDSDDDPDNFEEMELPEGEDSLNGTRWCRCSCHDIAARPLPSVQPGQPSQPTRRKEHCSVCGLKVIKGKLYIQTNDKHLRPAEVVYLRTPPHHSPEATPDRSPLDTAAEGADDIIDGDDDLEHDDLIENIPPRQRIYARCHIKKGRVKMKFGSAGIDVMKSRRRRELIRNGGSPRLCTTAVLPPSGQPSTPPPELAKSEESDNEHCAAEKSEEMSEESDNKHCAAEEIEEISPALEEAKSPPCGTTSPSPVHEPQAEPKVESCPHTEDSGPSESDVPDPLQTPHLHSPCDVARPLDSSEAGIVCESQHGEEADNSCKIENASSQNNSSHDGEADNSCKIENISSQNNSSHGGGGNNSCKIENILSQNSSSQESTAVDIGHQAGTSERTSESSSSGQCASKSPDTTTNETASVPVQEEEVDKPSPSPPRPVAECEEDEEENTVEEEVVQNNDADISTQEWNRDEDRVLLQLCKEMGPSPVTFTAVAGQLPGRSEEQISARFVELMRLITGDIEESETDTDASEQED